MVDKNALKPKCKTLAHSLANYRNIKTKAMIRLLIFLLFVCCRTAYSQIPEKQGEDVSLDPKQVPAVAVQNFTSQNPNATPAWRMDGQNYRASYVDPQSKLGRIVVYDKNGNVVRTENEVDNAHYPSSIGDYYSEKYPGETYQVWLTDEQDGAKALYYTNRNAETIWFDKNGKIMPAQKARKNIKKEPEKK